MLDMHASSVKRGQHNNSQQMHNRGSSMSSAQRSNYRLYDAAGKQLKLSTQQIQMLGNLQEGDARGGRDSAEQASRVSKKSRKLIDLSSHLKFSEGDRNHSMKPKARHCMSYDEVPPVQSCSNYSNGNSSMPILRSALPPRDIRS